MGKELSPILPLAYDEIGRLLSDEAVIRICARALYNKLDRESGEWDEISESDQEHYCGAVEWLRDALLCHLESSADGFPTTAR